MNADDADCDVLTTMSQGRIEPRQNCFQKKRWEGEWGELTLKDSKVLLIAISAPANTLLKQRDFS